MSSQPRADVRVQRGTDLNRRLLNLGLGELAASLVFGVTAVTSIQPRLTGHEARALWAALGVLLAILLQAGAYWLLARSWLPAGRMPATIAAVYRALRVVDIGLLVGSVGAISRWYPERPAVAVLVTGVWHFAVVEYVNYFVVRLAYPWSRWAAQVGQWRTPQLVKDLRRA